MGQGDTLCGSSPNFTIVEQYVQVSTIEEIIQIENISKNIQIFHTMYLNNKIQLVQEEDIRQKTSDILNARISQINEDSDALDLLDRMLKDPEFKAIQIIRLCSAGAGISSLDATMIENLVGVLIQLSCLSENMKRLVETIAMYASTMGIDVPDFTI